MDITANKKQTAFRLDSDLLDRLKVEAKKANRSLNNYVECVLMDSVYKEPNETTKAAIEEAKTGRYAGKVDMTNYDAFIKSIEDIE